MATFIHKTAKIGKNVKIRNNVSIWEKAQIGDNVSIGCNVVIHPYAYIGDNVTIEDNSVLGKRVTLAKTTKEDQVKKAKGVSDGQKQLIIRSGTTVKANVVILEGTIVGDDSFIGDGSFIREEVTLGNKVLIGSHVVVEQRTTIGSNTKIEAGSYITAYSTIENNVFIGPCVSTSNDKWMGRTEKRFQHRYGVTVRAGARVGLNAIILPEVTIGKEAVIGAGAVVTKDVSPFTIVIGSPAKYLKLVPKEEVLEEHLAEYPQQQESKEIPFLNLKKQYLAIKKDIDAAIQEVIDKGNFILGDNVKELEKEIASYVGAKHAIGVASGSDALILALRALDIGEDDEVITTPYTFFATAGAIANVGAKPVFVDIDEQTFNIDPNKIQKAITKRTKAIIPVHLYGNPCDMDKILEIAHKHKLYIIEDAAQALGARYKGKMIGSLGHIGIFSFFPSKNLGCYGDGGMVVTSDDKIAERVRQLRVHGAKQKYIHQEVGINSRLDELQAAILRVKLRKLEEWTEQKRQIAALYNKLLKDIVETPLEQEDGKHVYHLYTIKTAKRDALAEYLKSKGIAVGIYYPLSLHLQEAFKHLKYRKGSIPISEKMTQEVLSLPSFPELTVDEVTFICNKIKEFLEK